LGVDVIACPIEGMRRRAQLGIGGNVLDLDRPSRKRDDREAARLYKLSADQGNAYAQDNLCRFYEPRSAEVV
jgi:hypothetical protein